MVLSALSDSANCVFLKSYNLVDIISVVDFKHQYEAENQQGASLFSAASALSLLGAST